jgi:hypothetical protein
MFKLETDPNYINLIEFGRSMDKKQGMKPCPKCQTAEKVLPICYGYPDP